MVDVHTKEQRSYNMSRIRSKNTVPELTIRKLLFGRGCRNYRVNTKLTGKPDIVFPSAKVAIFIDGCFWHKCRKCFVRPKTDSKHWQQKISRNVKRDVHVNAILKKEKWEVLRFWEHGVKKNPEKIVDKIMLAIK